MNLPNIKDEILSITQILLDLQIQWENRNTQRNIAPPLNQEFLEIKEAPAPSSSLQTSFLCEKINSQDFKKSTELTSTLSNKIISFHHLLSSGDYPTSNQIYEWKESFIKMIAQTLQEYGNESLIGAAFIDTFFLNFTQAIACRVEESSTKKSPDQSSLNSLISSLAELHKTIPYWHNRQSLGQLWNTSLFVCGALLFNELTEKNSCWVDIYQIYNWSPNQDWETTLDRIYQKYPRIKSDKLTPSSFQPIFYYEMYSQPDVSSKKKSIKIEHSPEFLFSKSEYRPALKQLEVFKKFLNIKGETDSLQKKDEFVYFPSDSFFGGSSDLTDYSLDPITRSMQNTISLQYREETAPKKQLNTLIHNTTLAPSIHPTQMKLLESVSYSQSNKLLSSRWIEMLNDFKASYKNNPELQKELRIPIYNYFNPEHPSFKNGFVQIKKNNRELVKKLFDHVQDGCFSQEFGVATLCWELFWSIEGALNEEIEWMSTLQEIRNRFIDEFSLSKIIEIANIQERRFYLACYLQNELRTALPLINNLLQAHQDWHSCIGKTPLSTFEIKIQHLYTREIQKIWSSLSSQEKETILKNLLEPQLLFKRIDIQLDSTTSFPRANLFDDQSKEFLGFYEGLESKFRLKEYLIDPSPYIKEEFLDLKTKEIFGDFKNLNLIFFPHTYSFQSHSQRNLEFQQVKENGSSSIKICYTDISTGLRYTSSNFSTIKSYLLPGMTELYSSQNKSLLLCKWNSQKLSLDPLWQIEESCITSISPDSPTKGCYIGVPEANALELLLPFLNRSCYSSIHPLFWFKEGKLRYIQVTGGAVFDCYSTPYRCYLDGLWYECATFTFDEEPLELLNGHSFKLIDPKTGEIYWFGHPKYIGRHSINSFPSHTEQLRDLYGFDPKKQRAFKIPLIEGTLHPQTDLERLFLVKEAIDSRHYSTAIEWTKRLTEIATLTSEVWSEPFPFNGGSRYFGGWLWKKIFTHPASRTIGNLFYFRIREIASKLDSESKKKYTAFMKFYSHMEQEYLNANIPTKHPKSKKRFLKESRTENLHQYSLSPNSTLPYTGSLKWKKITIPEQLNEIPTFEHHRDLMEAQPILIPKIALDANQTMRDTGIMETLPELIRLYSSHITEENRSDAILTLGNSYDRYRSLYIDFQTYAEDPFRQDHPMLSFRGFAGDFIQQVATRLGFKLEVSDQPPLSLLPDYISDSSLSHNSSCKLEELSAPNPTLLPPIKPTPLSENEIDLPTLELKLLTALTPHPNLGKALLTLHHEPIPTLDEISQMVLTNDIGQWRSFRGYLSSCTDQELAQLRGDILHYLELKIQPLPPATRSYELTDPVAPFFLLYEEKSGMRLRKDQVENIKFLLEALKNREHKANRKMLQSLMGSGKSKVLTPLLLLYLQKQHNMISSYTTTKALLGTTIEESSIFLFEKFGITTHQIDANRHTSREGLLMLKQQIAEAKLGKAILFSSSDTLHALHLSLPLLLLSKTRQEDYDLICEIIKELEKNQALIIDECDWLLHPRQQMSYPLGIPKSLPVMEIRTASQLYFQYVSKYAKELRIAAKESHTVNLPAITTKILSNVVRDLYKERKNALITSWIQEMEKNKIDQNTILLAIANYLSDQELPKEALACLQTKINSLSMVELRQLGCEEIGILQYAFGKKKGLAKSLKSPFKSSYGRSLIDKKRHLVIPWSNSIPQEGTQFQDGYQTLFKTCLYYLHEWRDPADTTLLIQEALKSITTTLGRIKNPELVEALQYYLITSSLDEKQSAELTERFNNDLCQKNSSDPEVRHIQTLIQFFLNQVVFSKELKLYSQQLLSTSTTLLHSSAYQLGLSGTREGSSAWEKLLDAKWDSTQIPLVLKKAVKEKCTAIQGEMLTTPMEKIDAIFKKLEPNTRALIDVGGMFRGLDPQKIAQNFLLACPISEGVLFYHTLPSGLSELRILFPDGETQKIEDSSLGGVVNLMKSKGLLKEELLTATDKELFEKLNILTFYDEAHTRGSDLPQKNTAHALLLYDETCTETDLQQAIMRLRNYLKDQSLTWVYSAKENQFLTPENLIAKSQIRQMNSEKLAHAQSLLDRLQHGAMQYLIRYATHGHSFEESGKLADRIGDLLIDCSADYVCFSPFLPEHPSYFDLIQKRLEKIKKTCAELNSPEALKHFNPLIHEIQMEVNEHREDLKSLLGETTQDEGVQEQNQEQDLNLDLNLQQQRTPPNWASKDTAPTISLHSPICTKDSSSFANRIDPKTFLPEENNPEIISEHLFLDSNLFLSKESMPWNDYSYPIDAVLIYKDQPEPSDNLDKKNLTLGVALRGDTLILIDKPIVEGILYDLKGECITFYQPEKGAIELPVSSFSRTNIFEEIPTNSIGIEILCSAILISGNINLLLDEKAKTRNHHFFNWLNNVQQFKLFITN